jgi:signal transduction histidine kinase
VRFDVPNLGREAARHIDTTVELASAPAVTFISVLARIAVRQPEAKNSVMSRIRIVAWAVGGTTIVFLALGVAGVGSVLGWFPHWWLRLPICAVFSTPVLVGLLIANRQPRNRIAWILILGPFALTLQLPFGAVLGKGWALQIDRGSWPLLFAWPIAVAYVFPTGRLPSRRWRWIAAAAAVSFVCFVGIAMTDPTPFDGDNASTPNPIAHNAVGEWLSGNGIWIPFWFAMLATFIAGAVAMVLKLRRSTGVEHLQAMWLAWSAATFPVALFICGLASFLLGDSFFDAVFFVVLMLMQVAIPVSIGIAVLRYRLYAIEEIANRTVVYATLTTLLLATYAAITIGLGVLVGGDSPWVIALATLVVALAFRPVRGRVQDAVDRRYRRARYEGVRRIRAFEDDVRDGRQAPEQIGAVLAQALADPLAEIYFWLPETEAYADVRGDIAELPVDDRARREIRRSDARTATLLHDPTLLERRTLLDGVLSAAALSIEMARLRVEVRIQLAEVAASRTRIVEAGYEERRRLERDLHDGAQQRLVSLGVQLRRLQLTLPREARILSSALDQIVEEVGAAIVDLRQIAAGVRPARLDEGLAAALRDLARTSPVPVDVDASGERVAASVEAAAYFVACEALTNAVKHAAPSKVAVRAVRQNGMLYVSVADDGVGGAVVRRGSGLAGLRDRVAAHSGTFDIVSPRGGGTRVEVALPCES